MDEPRPISRRTRAEAAAWLARLRADDRNLADERGFHAWLAADPEHAAAFDAVDRMWAAVGGAALATDAQAPPVRRYLTPRRAILCGVGILVLGGASFSVLRSASARVYETGVGEQKRLSLEDGSLLFLDAQTRVTVSFSQTLRAVDMQFGRANFRVASDARRPFIVQAAERQIVANQCNFDVRCDGSKVQVVLIHGEADVHPVSPSPHVPSARLRGGERMIAAADIEKFDRPQLAPLLAWQAGYAVFESRRLDEAVDEMNRYSEMKLSVDPAVAGLQVSGVYRVGDNVAFARSMAKLLPVTLHEDGQTLLLAASEK